MLNPRMIPDKTYEGLMEEIYSKIPIYSGEWTNYNPSDPGITILENFSAFQILQQDQMDAVPQSVRAALLALVGYTPKKGSSASVLIEPEGLTEDILLPADQRFYVGDISFETTLAQSMTSSHITGVFAQEKDGGLRDVSFLRDHDHARCVAVFGKTPKAGACVYLVLDKPLAPGEEGRIYVNVLEDERRTPFDEDTENDFAKLRFEAYCEDGFVPMTATDHSHAFLADGELRLTQPAGQPAVYVSPDKQIEGYVWRIVLAEEGYDLAPQLRHISGFLFPARQKETMVITHSFQKASDASLDCVMLESGYVRVFAKEEKGTSYYLYDELPYGAQAQRGRFYEKERLSYGSCRFHFDRDKFGYAPGRVRNALKVVVYNEEMMRRFYLGEIYGYDRQEIELPAKHIVTDTFSLIAQRFDADGTPIYDFVKPGRGEDGQMSYYLYENEGKICILDAGDYIGAKLYLGSIAVTLGEEGNVRTGNVFVPDGYDEAELRFTNPAPGVGGCFQETVEQVRRRFVRELYQPSSAVLASDYETLVKQIPGLCISKVHAWMDYANNEVKVTVLPATEERFPQISERYCRKIESYLDERRMLSARVTLCQPVYAQVLVRGTIYVKPHYEGCREQIEEVIRQEIDSITGQGGFGSVLRFDRLFRAVEALACVSYVYDLGLAPKNRQYAVTEGADIRPAEHCLLYPGPMKLDIIPQAELG